MRRHRSSSPPRFRYIGREPSGRPAPVPSLLKPPQLHRNNYLQPKNMDMLPDLGSWLLRSVARRDHFTNNPVLNVERLNSLPRPLQDAHKELLIGAVLTMSSSLSLALGMLQELFPQEISQDRLGEVLCPTLGHLLASLQSTLTSFDWKPPPPTPGLSGPPSTNSPERIVPSNAKRKPPPPGPEPPRPATAVEERLIRPLGWPNNRPAIAPSVLRPPTRPATSHAESQRSPPPSQPDASGDPARQPQMKEADVQGKPETQLVQALHAEMRVQAAIQVAIESLEFAESQLKVVKEVNQLHGGNFDALQKNFYSGYNRLLLKALELQRRELGLQQDRDSLLPAPGPSLQRTSRPPTANGYSAVQKSLQRQPSVTFDDTLSPPTPRPTGMARDGDPQRRPLGRRNTIPGIRPEDSRTGSPRPILKRRLSLAEELAMVGEDSESGYQDETSEMEQTSASESEEDESDANISNGRGTTTPTTSSTRVSERRGVTRTGWTGSADESEEYSTNAESAGEERSENASDDDDDDDDEGDKTLDAFDMDSSSGNTATSRTRRQRRRV
ncbi:uncharacterized protein B0T15DRAFT_135694 [Chaetomium strumarium]|uniref:Uncharacterized protein n=1 Tax=Chaetomium strumarium TaxID=1170767 RepID=A0AAJ0M561_9PEZI|nr:hypothetical protein B0T15DRAFT_135694 [Chaetomium strumarium]